MGIGYIVGCFLNIMLNNFNKKEIFNKINLKVKKILKDPIVIQIFYSVILIITYVLLKKLRLNEIEQEIYNLLTALLVINVEKLERKKLNKIEKIKFYDYVSYISQSVVCNFTAPLLYIVLFRDNAFGILYMLLYSFTYKDLKLFSNIINILLIIPSLIVQMFLIIVYLFNNKKFDVDFKGDYFLNCITKPILNVNIMAAYVQSINFYYHFNGNNVDYLKIYGNNQNKIDKECIKNYMDVAYIICIFVFILFYITNYISYKI